MAAGEFRLRVCHRKRGSLAFLSHLEVARAIERSARRAGLAYAVTHGFNPRMKVAFGPALPVGTAGMREYFDLWLTEYLPSGEALRRLAAATVPDLAPSEARFVGSGLPSLAAALTIARYEVALGEEVSREGLQEALDEVTAGRTLAVPHKGKEKVFDLARVLPKEARAEVSSGRTVARIDIRMGPEGALRPEALVGAALSRRSLPGAVVSVTRTDILIEEGDVWARPI